MGGALTTYVTGLDITNAFEKVLNDGRTAFLTGVSGITLNVVGSGEVQGTVEPEYGFHENFVSNGVAIVATASEFVTNSAQNIEFRCAGWILSSTNSDEVVTNTASTTAEITPVPNGAYTLTWLWETNAVKITTEVLVKSSYGVIEPGTGWFPFGEDVTFIATGNTFLGKVYTLFDWPRNGDDPLNDNDDFVELGNMLVFRAMRPATIQAEFRSSGTEPGAMPTFNLKVVNYGVDDVDVPVPDTVLNAVEPPNESINGTVIPYDTEKELVQTPLSVQLTTNEFTVSNGEMVKVCRGWMLSNEEGILDSVRFDRGELVGTEEHPKTKDPYASGLIPLSVVGFKPSDYGITNGASVTLTWLWEIPPTDDLTNVFDIVWNDDLDNLGPGYVTNLITEVALGSKGWTLDDLTVNVPTGWVAVVSLTDGNVVAALARDDAALAATMESCELIVTNAANGTLAVKATITNGLRGFWYVLYGSDDLVTWEPVTAGTYESGTPAAQAQGSAENPVDKVELSIIVTPGDSAAGPKRFYKVVSGATSEPLAE
jgi:hypothetical protein